MFDHRAERGLSRHWFQQCGGYSLRWRLKIIPIAVLDWEAELKFADAIDAHVVAICPSESMPRHCQSAATKPTIWLATMKYEGKW